MASFVRILALVLAFVASAIASSSVTDLVYVDVELGGSDMGRILIGLFGDEVPLTAENFRTLAAGTTIGNVNLGYTGNKFFSVSNTYLATGDVTNNDGTASTSIFGTFPKESTAVTSHSTGGLVSMVGDASGNIGSQFLITFNADTSLDATNVVVGKVIEGLGVANLVAAIASTDNPNSPTVTIKSSGIVY